MKLLFDQNLSFRLCHALEQVFPESSQVRLLGLDQATDETIWRTAREEGFALVTLDTDFRDLAALRGAPPHIVLLRCGNRPTAYVIQLLIDHAEQIVALPRQTDVDCLEIG